MTGLREAEPLPWPLKAPSALRSSGAWEELRQKCPVARVSLPSGGEAVLLTRYEERTTRLPAYERLLTAPLRELPVRW